MIRKGEGLG